MQRTLITFAIVWMIALALVAGLVGCGDGGSGKPGGSSGLLDGGGDDAPETGDESGDEGEDSGDEGGEDEGTPGIGGYTVVEVSNGGSIKGFVSFDGDAPGKYKYTASEADVEICAGGDMGKGERKNIRLQLGERDGGKKGVAHVVVRVEVKKGKGLADGQTVTLDNKNCEFHPLVTLIPYNAKIKITNSDATNHNTKGVMTPRGDADQYQAFNPNLKKGGASEYNDGFENPGVIRLTCDQHYWMEGYGIVQEHPYYALTDAKGNFEIKDLPPGKYTVTFWHAGYAVQMKDGKMSGYEKPKTWTAEVEVKGGESKDMGEIAYKK